MGNYQDIETEFIERTIRLIDQYYDVLEQYHYEEQFNYTLTINCMLGLIVMPKERDFSYIPNTRITNQLKNEIGLENSQFGEHINSLRELIQALRNSVAHFDINVISDDHKNRIDWVEFRDSQNQERLVASFRAKELFSFLKYYANCLLENMRSNRR